MDRTLKVAFMVALIVFFWTRDGMAALMAAAAATAAEMVANVL